MHDLVFKSVADRAPDTRRAHPTLLAQHTKRLEQEKRHGSTRDIGLDDEWCGHGRHRFRVADRSGTGACGPPGQTSATLHIIQDPQSQSNYLLAILGRFPMPEADAVGFLNNINNGDCQGGMNYYVFGDDGGREGAGYIHFKPVLGAHNNLNGYLKASSQGLEYRTQIPLRKSFLNEDSGVLGDNDEIYAQAHFKDSDCKIRIQTSQVITGLF